MNKKITLQIILFSVAFLLFTGNVFTSSSGINSPLSGSPQSNNQTCAQCHGGGSITNQSVTISTDIPPGGYLENTDYTIKVVSRGNGSTAVKGGFNATIEDGNGFAGTLSNISGSGTAVNGNSATQTSGNNTFTGDSLVWRFRWNSGSSNNATVYVAANFANGNGTTTGDAVATQSLVLTKSSIGLEDISMQETKVYPNPATSVVNLSAYALESGMLNISLYDALGRQINQLYTAAITPGKWTQQFSVDEYAPGNYFLLMELNGKITHHKLIIE